MILLRCDRCSDSVNYEAGDTPRGWDVSGPKGHLCPSCVAWRDQSAFPLRDPTRRFRLVRKEDASGVSGTGHVADGCVFPNGKAVLAWRVVHPSVAVYDSMEGLMEVHGHGGATVAEWLDP
jgi:hypothetical protein